MESTYVDSYNIVLIPITFMSFEAVTMTVIAWGKQIEGSPAQALASQTTKSSFHLFLSICYLNVVWSSLLDPE